MAFAIDSWHETSACITRQKEIIIASTDVKVLLLENDASHAEAIRRAFLSSTVRYQVQVAPSLREYRASVDAAPPDIALLSMAMHNGSYLELVTSCSDANRFPVLILANNKDEKAAEAAIKAGALDYVVKSPQAFAVMPGILSRAMSRWQLIQERDQAEESRRVIEQDFRLLADYHKQLNDISISFIEASDTRDLFNRIAESLRLLTGAIATTFSLYNQETQDLNVVSLSVDPVCRDKVDSIFGPDLFEIRMQVSNDVMEKMLGKVIRRPKDLSELTFGLIPSDVSVGAMRTAGCQQIVALAISHAAELVGTCVAYLPGDRPDVPDDTLKTYVHISGLAIKRRWMERTLQKSEEKYSSILDQMDEVYYEVDARGNFRFFNNALRRQLGYSAEELTGLNYQIYVLPEERRRVAEACSAVWDTGVAIYRMPVIKIRKDGSRIFVEDSIFPIRNEKGEQIGLRGISFDITYRKRFEEELQRVARLESVGLLAGGIAHDFNNILTAILGNISLASTEAEPGSEMLKRLEQAEKASLRARDLTQQLLAFSKGGTPVKKLTSLTELLRDTAGFALHGSNAKCQVSLPDDLWHAEINEGQVSQVIHNLVINAQQAMPAGGTVEVCAENLVLTAGRSLGMSLPLKEGNYVRIAVTDHGTGIHAEHLGRIFDPFFTTKQKGSGLGLATSFSIVRNHGGHLSVESVIGRGSTFYMYLPASEKRTEPGKAEREPTYPCGRVRILLMDDEELVRDIAGRMLTHIGYEDIDYATNGAEAVKLYKAAMESGKPFNVVILDLTIPGGMGGRATIKKLLELDPGVKAIVSSGYANESTMTGYKEYGFSGMAAKPYTVDTLRRVLSELTGGTSVQDS